MRISAWPGENELALISPEARATVINSALIDASEREAAALGYRGILWQATSEFAGLLLEAHRYHERDRLAVLIHHRPRAWRAMVDHLAPPLGIHLRRGHAMDLREVLIVDRLSFEPFWQLDSAGIDEAILATPRARYRVALDTRAHDQDPRVVGYAIMGQGAGAGFLQRLAVHPDARGLGIGSLLVADGFKWLTRWGCRSVSVNTQETNERALKLYEHLGFLRQQRGIVLYESPPLR